MYNITRQYAFSLMTNFKKAQAALLALVFTVAVAGSVSAVSNHSTEFSNIKIKNFGQMDERFYRGAQPGEADYKDLAALGIKTIIDLRDDPKSYEKPAAEAAGMRYINIPMSDKKRPQDSQIEEFLKIVNDPATGAFYVHCAGGRHRTGVMGAVYRVTQDGWDFDQVYKEMKQYDYYSRWGHGALKDYVQDFCQARHEDNIHASAGATSSSR